MSEHLNIKPYSHSLQPKKEAWLKEAWSKVNVERLSELLTGLVDIPSPTGQEGAVAKMAVGAMREAGLIAQYEEITPNRGNAIGRLNGIAEGPHLLFYGHFDNYIPGSSDDPLVVGAMDHPSFHPNAIREQQKIFGAGASNPKAGCAMAMHALEIISSSKIPIAGKVTIALASGGIHKVELLGAGRPYLGASFEGMGAGCEHMLHNGLTADYCIITKPGYQVLWEEPGILWIKLSLRGVVGYVATKGKYKRPIDEIPVVIEELNQWFEAYEESHSNGQVLTPAHIGAIEGGWPYKPDFSPSVCNLYIDIRVHPDSSNESILREFEGFIENLKSKNPSLDLTWEPYASIPGTKTNPESAIVNSLVRAWERIEQSPHGWSPAAGMTDAAILRSWGIPTARLGTQSFDIGDPSLGFLSGETADLENMAQVVKAYIYAIIDTCT